MFGSFLFRQPLWFKIYLNSNRDRSVTIQILTDLKKKNNIYPSEKKVVFSSKFSIDGKLYIVRHIHGSLVASRIGLQNRPKGLTVLYRIGVEDYFVVGSGRQVAYLFKI